MLRIPYCLDNRFIDGGKVVSLTHRPRSTPQKHHLSAVGFTQPLPEMSTRSRKIMFLGSRALSVRKADLTAICEPIV
jgi:hypothetical protein